MPPRVGVGQYRELSAAEIKLVADKGAGRMAMATKLRNQMGVEGPAEPKKFFKGKRAR